MVGSSLHVSYLGNTYRLTYEAKSDDTGLEANRNMKDKLKGVKYCVLGVGNSGNAPD
jgi:hypothetical protein